MAETQKLSRQARTPAWGRSVKPIGWIKNLSRNPIILKELRGRMRSWRALFILGLYIGALSLFAVLTYSVVVNQPSGYYNGYYGYSYSYYYGTDYERLGSGIFSGIIVVQLLLIGLLSPGYTVGVLSGEKERQTYEILLLTLLRPHEIVLGKLFATLLYLFLLIIAAIPVESIVFLVGGVGLDQLAIGLIVPLLTVLLLGTLGLAWSSLLRTTVRASRAAYLSGIGLLLGIPALGFPMGIMVYGFQNSNAFSTFLLNWASAFNPVVAVVASNTMLTGNSGLREHNIFYYIRTDGQIYPMPWLIFMTMALALSAFFVTFAIRFVKPLKNDGDFAQKKKK